MSQLILKILSVSSWAIFRLSIFLLKNVAYCLIGCIKILFAPRQQAFTALVLIAACLIDVSFAYKHTNNYQYGEFIHLIIILSPFAYLASVGKQSLETKGGIGK
jgi:hypothetical protein